MLLTITTSLSPATDLGYLLYKHPDRRFGVDDGSIGAVYTRTGRPFFAAGLTGELLDRSSPWSPSPSTRAFNGRGRSAARLW